MAPHKFELSEINDSQTNLTTIPGKSRSGCYVSTAVGFVLVLLAAVVAVGVGIIVHFAGGNRSVVCNCQSSPALGAPSAEAIKNCAEIASQGNQEICQRCPANTTLPQLTTTAAPGTGTTPKPTEPSKVKDVRLPKSVYPLHYDVELQPYIHDPDPHKFTFKGNVRIKIRCDVATDNVTLHVNVLTITPSTIKFTPDTPSGSADPQYSRYDEDEQRQFFIVRLNKNMEVGKIYWLEMHFTSPLKNDLHGLYYSEYTRNSQKVYLVTTQFQPTDARKAFPCFDEPAIKATFNITLVRPSHLVSISNMPILRNDTTFTEDGRTYVKDVYQTTPKMSTYLLAFIICDFQHTYNYTKNGTLLYRAWATPESLDQTYYALDTGVKIINYYEDYFGVPFPLPKQDMIAIPDFSAGAMENWGLITYRETAMLYKVGVSNEANKERVAIVVSHELAHQWFGNLVTPSWWDDLWLNEGFASFVEYLGVDKVHPDWKMFDTFVTSDVQSALGFDGLISSHPLYVPVQHPDEINEIFDTISYAKGASVIRMMRHFLGEGTFKLGLKNYLEQLSYGAAFHDDLWNALTNQAVTDGKSHIQVKEIMDTWALQMNYPVVTVTRDFNNINLLHVEQQRYLSNPSAKDPKKYESPFNYQWTIPLTFTSSSSLDFDQDHTKVLWISRNETRKTFNVTIPLPNSSNQDGWILANVNQLGYYRVNYQVGNWLALSRQLERNHFVIPIINRAQIINDAWNLAKAGHIGLETALATIEYLRKEKEYIPWYAARSELNFVDDMLAFTSLYGPFQSFMKDQLNETFRHFGLQNIAQRHVDVLAQSLIVGQSCYYGIQSCLDEVTKQYREWMKNSSHNPINPNIKTTVYCNAIANGGWDEWKFALEMYKAADVASEKANLLSAMACSKKQWILNHYMKLILEENTPVRKQDALSVISNVGRNHEGRYLAWNFFRGNYDVLKEQFGGSSFSWSNVIGALVESFNTDFDLKELSAFKQNEQGNLGSGERAFDQALEKVAANIRWMKINLPIITKWLKDKKYHTE